MSPRSTCEADASTLLALIDLHHEEEKQLRSLIIATKSPIIRLEAILDLEQVMQKLDLRQKELSQLEKPGASHDENLSPAR